MKKYVFESLKFFCAAILCTILSAFATPSHAALPDGYTELQYIESTGTQYIDTGYTPTTAGYSADVKFMLTGDTKNNQTIIGFNTEINGVRERMSFGLNGTGTVVFGYGSGNANIGYSNAGSDNITLNNIINLNVIYTFPISLTIDGNTVFTTESATRAGTAAVYLMAVNSSSGTTPSTGRWYSAKIYNENNTLVRDFVPAKNSSGVVGMYDTVNEVFYENKGTGEFIAGPDACDGTVVNYTSATGTGVQNGTPTPDNPIEPVFYQQGNMVLRKVGDYADSYDATTGKITRRVGVKVLDGTENWMAPAANQISISKAYLGMVPSGVSSIFVTHYPSGSVEITNGVYVGSQYVNFIVGSQYTKEQWKQYLAQQYAAGTPVTIYYPLATAVEEDWTETSYCSAPIKIATTKYNETAFGPLNTALANAISVVDSVVSNTITQAGRIATLQAQKQTRPNDIADDSEKCPAGKKCLLVEDASGVPHWYEIVERYSILPDGYTELEYIESTGTQYLDLDTGTQTGVFKIIADVYAAGSTDWQYLFGYSKDTGGSPLGVWVSKNQIKETFAAGNGNVIADVNKWEHIDITNSNTVTIPDFYIFHVNPTGITSYTINPGRIKYLQLKKDGDTIRNMVSAKRNSDGVVGMYDTVGNRFYTNAGTGEFIAGDPVSE